MGVDMRRGDLAPLLIMKMDIATSNGTYTRVPEEPVPEIGLTAMCTGRPGTGKSQFIANLLLGLYFQDKTGVSSLVVSGRGAGGSDRWFNFYPQILNVALSRAKRLLYIIGDKEYCSSRSGALGTDGARPVPRRHQQGTLVRRNRIERRPT